MKFTFIFFRKVPLLIGILMIFFSATQAQNTISKDYFVVSGKINTNESYRLVLTYQDEHDKTIIDTTYAINGRFRFEGLIAEPTYAALTGKLRSKSFDDPNFLRVFLEPTAMSVALTIDNFGDAKVVGSLTQEQWEKINFDKRDNYNKNSPLLTKWRFFEELIKKSPDDPKNKLYKDSIGLIQNELSSIRAGNRAIDISFMRNNPNSFLSPWLLGFYTGNSIDLSLDSSQTIYESFSFRVKNSHFGLRTFRALQVLNKMQRIKDTVKIGSTAPDFSRTDINKKEISLSSYIGKNFILLDFWAGWCVPCLKFAPHVKELYNRYHGDGLKIISISLDNDVELWKQAVSKHKLNDYINVYDLPGGMKRSDADAGPQKLSTVYKADTIPTFILIGKDGKVAAIYHGIDDVGQLPDLDKKLAELIENKPSK